MATKIDFTVEELRIVREAVENAKMMYDDLVFDDLYVRPGETRTFTHEEMNEVRETVEANLKKCMAVDNVLDKLNGF